MAAAPRALSLAPLLLAAGCTTAASPERVAELRTLEAESAARLTAEGEILFQAEPITLQSYKSVDGATRLLEEGELRRGIREASKALFLGRTAGPALVAMAKRDLAYAYNLAGDLDRAATYATEAVDTATSTPADWFRPATRERVLGPSHKLVGDVRLRQGRVKDAIAAYDRALAASETDFVPFVRASLANAHLAAGSPARARELFRQTEPGASPSVRALVRRGLGRVLLAEKRYQEAARWFEEAARAGGDDQAYERLWALDGLARARRGEGDRAGTIAAYRQAIDAAEQVRARFRSEEFKTGFFGDVQSVFEDAIRSMMEARQVEAALETSERGRSRALLDLLRGRGRQSAGAQAFADPLGCSASAAPLIRSSGRRSSWSATSAELRACTSALLEPDLLEGRRPRIGVDQHQRGLLHPGPDAARPDVLADRPEPHPLVDELLDLVQHRLPLAAIGLQRLLLEQRVDVGIAAVGVGARRSARAPTCARRRCRRARSRTRRRRAASWPAGPR